MRTFSPGTTTRLLLLLALAGVGGGCAMAKRVANDPVDYNQSLAEAHNRLLLLNIARASKNHPLFFTEVGEVNETLANGGALGVDFPWLNPANSESTLIKPGVNASAEAAFKLTPTMTKEYFSGITTQVSPSLFKYYWDQGWPRQLLLALVVRSFVLEPASGSATTYVGAFDFFAPDPTKPYREFRQFVNWAANASLDLKPRAHEKDEQIGLPLSPNPADPDTLRALVEADKAGYELVPSGNTLALYGPSAKALVFSIPVPRAFLDATLGVEQRAIELGRGGPEGKASTENVTMKVHLRSPEAILYHLGELVRAERTLGFQATLNRGGRSIPLFSAQGTSACGVSVTYCCERYSVGGDPTQDESMHVLSFLHQLIMLQKGAAEPPSSTFVRVLGGR